MSDLCNLLDALERDAEQVGGVTDAESKSRGHDDAGPAKEVIDTNCRRHLASATSKVDALGMVFVKRERELEALERWWLGRSSGIALVWGRRRLPLEPGEEHRHGNA